ncbi:scyllo-inosamine-4-phosphate amidinotransferase [Micromonospora ureilytica]|uniref:scyllo-inosamine-4-phosphate amidinotransferase n=1 Tax=Micromonospora ureilytica TaxID=709868 RepID=UPI0033F7378F
MKFVNVHNEWDPLEEVIVGDAVGARVPTGDKGLHAIRYRDAEGASSIPSGPHAPDVLEKAAEELELLVGCLVDLGIRVRRPSPTDHSRTFGTPDWRSDGMYNYCPRDILLAVGSSIIETPMSLRSRLYEPFAYKQILVDYMNSGANWVSAPKPALLDDGYNLTDPNRFAVLEFEPVFDAANVLKAGRDIIYLVSDTGNRLGAQWLQNFLGSEYRVHPCDNLYAQTHIDTTIVLLRPGLVLLNPDRVGDHNIPKPLAKWDKIYAPPMVDIGYTGISYGSAWVGMNLLMVNPELAIVDDRQTELIRLLNAHRIEVAPLRLTHARTLGGGFHCVTLDTRRTGTLEDYS